MLKWHYLFSDVSAFLISIALSCCFVLVLVVMGIKFPWFRRQLRLGSMAQMTATVNANAKKENTARVTSVPSQGVFKRWEDEEAGPPPEPVRIALRKNRPAPQPPGSRAMSLPPASRKNNTEAPARKSEVPARPERSSAKEASSSKAARKAEEERLKEKRRQEEAQKQIEKKSNSKEEVTRRNEAINVAMREQQRVEAKVDPIVPGPSRVPQLPPKTKKPDEKAVETLPPTAMIVSGTEEKGKKKEKKKKKKESKMPTKRNASAFNVPTNPMARRPSGQPVGRYSPPPEASNPLAGRSSPPPATINEVVFQKMNGVNRSNSPEAYPRHLSLGPSADLVVPRSPRPAIKSQARSRMPAKKKAPLGKPVMPPRIFTPPTTPPPKYEEQIPTPMENLQQHNLAFESDGILNFRLPDAPEPIQVHPSFLALSHGDESDECDA